MADNVTANPGAGGATFASDEDGGGNQHPYAKLEWGPDNTFTKVDTGANALPIQDGGNSITVDGSVSVSAVTPGTAAGNLGKAEDVAAASGDTGVVALAVRRDAASSGVDVDGDYAALSVTSTGALRTDSSGAVQPVSESGTWNINDISGTISLPTGAATLAEQQTQTTSLQLIDDVVYTDDTSTHATGTSKGALMMAAAVPTDTAVNANDIGAVAMTTDRKLHVSVQDALPAGTAAIGKLAANSGVDIGDVDVTSVTGGATAHDSPAGSINPLLIGGYASAAIPSDVSADNDAVRAWLLRSGALVVAGPPHLGFIANPYTLQGKTAQYTGTQTGTALWTPTSTKRLVIVSYQIQVGGTVAGTVQLWFEASNGDTTYTRGTDPAIFDGEFAPSATLKPGVVQSGLWIAPGADFDLRVTDSAAINPLTITVWGYEI